ncbi:MAG: hypothetical protein DRP64_17720, partial [Verrucomicrobia bacterium]
MSSLGMGEQGTGTIESRALTVTDLPLRLAVRGWDGPEGKQGLNKVELIDAETEEVLHVIAPPLSDQPVWIELGDRELKRKRLYIRLVDGNAGGGYAWIGFDGCDIGGDTCLGFDGSESMEAWKVDDEAPVVDTHYGVPFIAGNVSAFMENEERSISLGCKAKMLLLRGMTSSMDFGVPGWWYPKDYAMRFFVGDRLGEIRIEYADGQAEVYPLVLGDNLWWGKQFREYPEPFLADVEKGERLAELLHLHGVAPPSQGSYIAAIRPRDVPIDKIVFADAKDKAGIPVVTALSVNGLDGTMPENGFPSDGEFQVEVRDLVANKAMTPGGKAKEGRLDELRDILYTTTGNMPKHLDVDMPDGYEGPKVAFAGDISAAILANVFYHNLHQMQNKVNAEGMYHTSTIGAASFGGYTGFGTYAEGEGTYSSQVWSRDLGRAIQELVAFGKMDDAKRCVDYCFDKARLWETRTDDLVKIDGQKIPPHWCRNI